MKKATSRRRKGGQEDSNSVDDCTTLGSDQDTAKDDECLDASHCCLDSGWTSNVIQVTGGVRCGPDEDLNQRDRHTCKVLHGNMYHEAEQVLDTEVSIAGQDYVYVRWSSTHQFEKVPRVCVTLADDDDVKKRSQKQTNRYGDEVKTVSIKSFETVFHENSNEDHDNVSESPNDGPQRFTVCDSNDNVHIIEKGPFFQQSDYFRRIWCDKTSSVLSGIDVYDFCYKAGLKKQIQTQHHIHHWVGPSSHLQVQSSKRQKTIGR